MQIARLLYQHQALEHGEAEGVGGQAGEACAAAGQAAARWGALSAGESAQLEKAISYFNSQQ